MSRTLVAGTAVLTPGGPNMTQMISPRRNLSLLKALKVAALALSGTITAALLIGWAAFLLWLATEAVIAIVHWL